MNELPSFLADYFTRRPDRLARDVPFGEYCQIPGVNASLLREPTSYQMLCRLSALHTLPAEERAALEFLEADTPTILNRLDEQTPRTTPRMFAALVKSPTPDEKASAAQLDLCNSLVGGPVDCREFTATTIKKCVEKGWVRTFAKEVAEDGVSTQVKESRAVALTTGRAVHTAILEPHFFDAAEWQNHYQLSPTKTLTSKAALEALAAMPHLELITPEIVDNARRCRDAVKRHKEAWERLTAPGASEVTGEAWDEELQVMRKFRIDRLPDDPAGGFIDIKTTRENQVLLEPIRGAVYKHGYHHQFAYYTDGLKMVERKPRSSGLLVAVTKEEPIIVRLFDMVESELMPELSFPQKGREIYLERLAMFGLAYAEKNFEAYDHEGAVALTCK